MVCPGGDDRWSPVLPGAERTRLRNALQVFSNAISSGSNLQSATAQGLAAAEAEAHAQREHRANSPTVNVH